MNIIQFFFLLFMHLAHIFTGFFCPSFSNSTIYCAILFFVTLYLVFSLYFCISPLFRSKIGWEIVVGTSGGESPTFFKNPPLSHHPYTTQERQIHKHTLFLILVHKKRRATTNICHCSSFLSHTLSHTYSPAAEVSLFSW